MLPKAEFVHWWFATGFLIIGLLLLAEAIVGEAAWRRRPWRVYLWPSSLFLMGVLMWPVMVFYTNSTIHMLAHGSWAQAMMLAGAAELGVARGKLQSPYWSLATAGAFLVSAAAILLHEQNGWLYARSAFVHHVCGWTLVVGALFPLGAAFRPRSNFFRLGFAATFIVLAIALYTMRDSGPVLGNVPSSAHGDVGR